MTFFAGDVLTAAQLNALPQGFIAGYMRGTGGAISGVSTTETGYIRKDGVAIRNGYTYRVTAARCVPTVSVAATSAICRLRGSTSSNATITSGLLNGGEIRTVSSPDTSNVPELNMVAFFDSTTTGTLSVILTIIRAQGTGTVGMFASSAALSPLMVEEIGLTPTYSGTDL